MRYLTPTPCAMSIAMWRKTGDSNPEPCDRRLPRPAGTSSRGSGAQNRTELGDFKGRHHRQVDAGIKWCGRGDSNPEIARSERAGYASSPTPAWWCREESNPVARWRDCSTDSPGSIPVYVTVESWSARWESNPQRPASQAGGYASSPTCRMVGHLGFEPRMRPVLSRRDMPFS